jgi:hypothetical protein
VAEDEAIAEFGPAFWECPPHTTVNHEAKFIMNQTNVDHKAYGWEGSYVYSIVRGFLNV